MSLKTSLCPLPNQTHIYRGLQCPIYTLCTAKSARLVSFPSSLRCSFCIRVNKLIIKVWGGTFSLKYWKLVCLRCHCFLSADDLSRDTQQPLRNLAPEFWDKSTKHHVVACAQVLLTSSQVNYPSRKDRCTHSWRTSCYRGCTAVLLSLPAIIARALCHEDIYTCPPNKGVMLHLAKTGKSLT